MVKHDVHLQMENSNKIQTKSISNRNKLFKTSTYPRIRDIKGKYLVKSPYNFQVKTTYPLYS